MAQKSWHLDRRTFLYGAGASLALPWLDCMTASAAPKDLPKRLCGVYVPFGVSLPSKDNQYAKWNWFPSETGRDFAFTETLKSLEPLRKKLTVIGGLSENFQVHGATGIRHRNEFDERALDALVLGHAYVCKTQSDELLARR